MLDSGLLYFTKVKTVFGIQPPEYYSKVNKEKQKSMNNICVFCGSSSGNNIAYQQAADNLAETLLKNNITLVYGGAHVGLMGQIANKMMNGGGKVIGIIPKALVEKEVAHNGLTELIVVNSMHERKSLMQEMSVGFIAMPGGLGTTEEIFEMLTWAQLKIHNKPCAFLNIKGYFDQLAAFLENMVSEGFLERGYKDMAIFADNIDEIITKFENYIPPALDKAQLALKTNIVV